MCEGGPNTKNEPSTSHSLRNIASLAEAESVLEDQFEKAIKIKAETAKLVGKKQLEAEVETSFLSSRQYMPTLYLQFKM